MIDMAKDQDFLTTKEIAARLRKSEGTVKRLLRDKIIPGYKVGGTWLVTYEDLNAYLEKQRNIQEEK